MLTARLSTTQQPEPSKAVIKHYGTTKNVSSNSMLDSVKEAAHLLGEMVLAERREHPLGDDDIKLERFQFTDDDFRKMCPHHLSKLQRRKGKPPMAKSAHEHAQLQDKPGKWPPKPFPPCRTKKEIISGCQGFDAIEKRVKDQLPTAEDSFESFAQKLTANCSSLLQKARAIYVWLATLNYKVIEKDTTIAEKNSLLDILHCVRVDKMYSSLFHLLCIGAGVPIHMIIGYKKGARHVAGKSLKGPREMGIWFSVFVDGEWRFVDAHWGCCSDPQIYEDFFLTDPDVMIFDHFPLHKEWQLLVHPISQETFEELVCAEPEHMHNMGLELASHPKGVIVVPSYAETEIKFEETSSRYEYETHLLRKEELNDPDPRFKRRNSVTGLYEDELDLNRYVFGQRKQDKLCFNIQLPQHGKYLFILLGKTSAAAESQVLIQYVLYGFKTRKFVSPLPMIIPVWGLLAARAGASVVGLDGAVVYLRRGQGEVRLKGVIASNAVYTTKFVSEKTNNRGKFFAIHWQSLAGEQVYHIMAFCDGQAAFAISTTFGEQRQNVAVFYVKSDRSIPLPNSLIPRSIQTSFGVVNSQRVQQTKFMPQSHNFPIIVTEKDNVTITWSADGNGSQLKFDCILSTLTSTITTKEDSSDPEESLLQPSTLSCTYEAFVWSCRLDFSEAGVYAANVIDKSSKTIIFSYLVFANLPLPVTDEPLEEVKEPPKPVVPLLKLKKAAPAPIPSPSGEPLPKRSSYSAPEKGTPKAKLSTGNPVITLTMNKGRDTHRANSKLSKSSSSKDSKIRYKLPKQKEKKVAPVEPPPPKPAPLPGITELSSKYLENHLLIQRSIKMARQKHDRDILTQTINRIRDVHMSELTPAELEKIQPEIRAAEDLRSRMERAERLSAGAILSIDNRALGELRSYSRPDPDIHTAVQATLLLLGHYEKRTRKWPRCQPLLKGILQDIRGYDHTQAHPGLAARAAQLLRTVLEDEITLKSAVAAALYHWSNGVVELLQESTPKKQFVPAKLDQQRLLLQITDGEEADLDWEDHGSLARLKKTGYHYFSTERR